MKSQNTLQNLADCRLDLDDQQFNLLDYLKADNCSQSVDLILSNEVDAIAEGLLNDAEDEMITQQQQEQQQQQQQEQEEGNAVDVVLPETTAFKCHVCLETCDLACDLETHMIAHPVDDRPYCTLCKKQFKDLKILKRHVRIHFKKKPFEVYESLKKNLRNFTVTKNLLKSRLL